MDSYLQLDTVEIMCGILIVHLHVMMCVLKLKTPMNVNDLTLWHERLGYVNEKRLKTGVNKHFITSVDCVNGDLPFCEAGVLGQQTRKPFKGSADVQSTKILQLVHSDVCGPMSVTSYILLPVSLLNQFSSLYSG